MLDTGIQKKEWCHPSVPMMSSQCSFLVIPVLDTGIQESLLVSKQTSTESGYNIFDEIIWKTGSQCPLLVIRVADTGISFYFMIMS
ncbi:hypothetical protein [Wolbachia endosymbiont (group A) of Anomoia purmunda]|uniref:hypothetical protein n=1 Tax=Wolbachia endosymbiont (group A) of Anomoia purmunda TaxID=2953978 RepID=UPI0022324618|nr:hypothetical protein [Wolbachia endosymbiont (group A) of Anomoia purmunda]